MKKTTIAMAMASLFLISMPGWAEDGAKAAAELGLVTTTGNTETQTLRGKLGVTHQHGKWQNSSNFESLKTSDQNATTAEKYLLDGKSEYRFSEHNYAFATLQYEDDRFSGYDYRIQGSAGYGRRLLHHGTVTLDAETGPGARSSKLSANGTENELTWRLAGLLAWDVSKTAKFTENLSADFGQDASIVKSVTALQAQVAGSLAMKLTYTVKYTSDVPVGIKKTDTESAVTLVYGF